jgi:methyl-accepting chemotaxis protein
MPLFARLKLAHKLLICSAVFLLPLAVLLYYTVSGFQQQIKLTNREITGAQALQPLCKLSVLLASRQMDMIAATVDSLLADIRRAERELGPLLPASADSDSRLLKSAALRPAAAEAARGDLLGQLYAVLPRLAETADLILDPELDSYYLADLALFRAPGLHEAVSHDPTSAPNPVVLRAAEHAVEVASAEDRRKHRMDSALERDLSRALANFKSAAGNAASLAAASTLWQTAAAHLAMLLDQRAAALRQKQRMALVLTLTTVAFAAGMLFVVVNNVSILLAGATQIADKIALGHLSAAEASLSQPGMRKYVRAGTSAAHGEIRDETFRLLDAFGTMAKSLDSLLDEVKKAYAAVDDSTLRMLDSLKQVESTFTDQAASTSQVAASSKEICATVSELAKNMRAVTDMAAEAAKLSNTGLTGLSGINTAMQETLAGADSVSNVLQMISTKAADIDSVLNTVTKIANRTNLISLNAAIEAEKAGQHAAGFSAVGLEIRRVADQTAVAALDIEKMLGDMQTAVRAGTDSVANYAERLRGNSQTIGSITAGIGRSIECTRTLEPHFKAVDSGMQMQAQAAREILDAMQQLSSAAGQSRDSLARFREIAERVRDTVNVLKSEVARFSGV